MRLTDNIRIMIKNNVDDNNNNNTERIVEMRGENKQEDQRLTKCRVTTESTECVCLQKDDVLCSVDCSIKYLVDKNRLCECKKCGEKFTIRKSFQIIHEALNNNNDNYLSNVFPRHKKGDKFVTSEDDLNKSIFFIMNKFICLHCCSKEIEKKI